MGSPCNYAVYIKKELYAKCRLAEDAAALCLLHPGAVVKYSSRIVWRGTAEHQPSDLGRAKIVIAQRRAQHWDEANAKYEKAKLKNAAPGKGACTSPDWQTLRMEEVNGKA